RPPAVELRQRVVGGIGQGTGDLDAPFVVEALHEIGIAAKGFGRRHVLHPVVFPQPVFGAERPQAAFRADSGTGQDHDVADLGHCPHEARPRHGAQGDAQWPASASSAAKDAWGRRWSGPSRPPDTLARAASTKVRTWPSWPTTVMPWWTSPRLLPS